MSSTQNTSEDEDRMELERLYTEYFYSVGYARDALHAYGMHSEVFREKDTKVGTLRRQIRDFLGAATKWDEWE